MNIGFFKTFIVSLLLCSLLWVMACATATGPGPTGTSHSSPSYGPEQSDPEFWRMWEDAHGGG